MRISSSRLHYSTSILLSGGRSCDFTELCELLPSDVHQEGVDSPLASRYAVLVRDYSPTHTCVDNLKDNLRAEAALRYYGVPFFEGSIMTQREKEVTLSGKTLRTNEGLHYNDSFLSEFYLETDELGVSFCVSIRAAMPTISCVQIVL
ncbi:hypothetical protein Tco_1139256 [Tanacetum coccineum]